MGYALNDTNFSITSFLEKIRDGFEIDSTELRHFILHLDDFPDEQIVAFLAHAYHKSLSEQNKVDLTLAMRDSGQVLDWNGFDKPVVDKHSTGGVGDKITIAMAPLVAALGLAMPTITGRGLGFSGGTLDKLAAIQGLKMDLSPQNIHKTVKEFGFCFAAQTNNIAPADRKLYALRDITATVPSIPLITASILSKKLAENLDVLVLDVKWGSGAFMQTLDEARDLAKSLVKTACEAGTRTQALITNMNQPLGLYSGNWCETAEAVHILKNPSVAKELYPDTWELLLQLTAQLLCMTDSGNDQNRAQRKITDTLASGKPFELFCKLVTDQGGDTKVFETDFDPLQNTRYKFEIRASKTGVIQGINTKNLGQALVLARAGRQKQTDDVAPNTALHHPKKIGASLSADEIICTLYTDFDEHEKGIRKLLEDAFAIGQTPVPQPELIEEVIT